MNPLAKLSVLIVDFFNEQELHGLYFDLGIEYEDLPGSTRVEKARSLVTYCKRHGRLAELLARLRELRPHVAWSDVEVSHAHSPKPATGTVKEASRGRQHQPAVRPRRALTLLPLALVLIFVVSIGTIIIYFASLYTERIPINLETPVVDPGSSSAAITTPLPASTTVQSSIVTSSTTRRLESCPADRMLDYGDLVGCSLAASSADRFEFDGNVGDVVFLQVTHLDGPMRPCIELFSPDGIKSDEKCGVDFVKRLEVPLEQTGTHVILITDSGGSGTGEYALFLQRVNLPLADAPALLFDQTVEGDLAAGETDLFTFVGQSGDVVILQVNHLDGPMRPCVRLVPPESNATEECGVDFSKRIDETLVETGTYRVWIWDNGGGGTGQYAVQLQCVTGPCAAS